MSVWGTIARVGGFAAAPFTAGWSIPAGLAGGAALDHVGGGDKKKDDAHPEDAYTSLLTKSAASNHATGQEATTMGLDTLRPVLDYFRQVMSPNAGALMDATRGERGRVIDQYDTARRSLGAFGPRGGGVTSALAGSEFQQAESLADVTSDAKAKAAGQAASAGVAATQLGLQSQSLAHADLETVLQSILAREGLNVTKHGQNMALAGDIGQAAGNLLGIWLGGGSDGNTGAGT